MTDQPYASHHPAAPEADGPGEGAAPGPGLSAAEQPRRRRRRTGRKRAVLASGTLLGVAALITGAAFTDYGLLNLGGSGGFGGAGNGYDLKFSRGQESRVDAVASWVEANPDAESVAPIEGADRLVPGGAPVYVNLPVLNASPTFDSSLELTFEDVSETASEPQQSKNAAYARLLRIDVAQVDDAAATAGAWTSTALSLGQDGKTPRLNLNDLAPEAGSIVVARVYLVDGPTQGETNAANGGGVEVQARFDGSSRS
ncbi:hypothetical protein NBM05_13395 [Rothia sp. AR01]|uniref:Uncharacterized protein n=1 Tax=Rothia santali TaxID=2949643 RepID=A0A9X2HJQ0_9MICC|nr:hypothetical protein [Rothia santali]MCP3426976.1 hypothetical protein [Rothia santali]